MATPLKVSTAVEPKTVILQRKTGKVSCDEKLITTNGNGLLQSYRFTILESKLQMKNSTRWKLVEE